MGPGTEKSTNQTLLHTSFLSNTIFSYWSNIRQQYFYLHIVPCRAEYPKYSLSLDVVLLDISRFFISLKLLNILSWKFQWCLEDIQTFLVKFSIESLHWFFHKELGEFKNFGRIVPKHNTRLYCVHCAEGDGMFCILNSKGFGLKITR